MVIFSNLVVLCPESEAGPGNVHLITEACDSPACHPCESDFDCKNDVCNHHICRDQVLSDAYNVPHQNKHVASLPSSEVINYSFCVNLLNTTLTNFTIPLSNLPTKPSRQFVLRI
jgi:hypothetical protein